MRRTSRFAATNLRRIGHTTTKYQYIHTSSVRFVHHVEISTPEEFQKEVVEASSKLPVVIDFYAE